MNHAFAPGLYRIPAEPQRAVRQLVRADVPVFVGYTDRGPVGHPVRLRTLTQFEALFGGGPGHLWDGVKGFLECGGDALHVIRVASATARAASVVQAGAPLSWQVEASFAWAMIDPRTLESRNLPGAQPWIAQYEEILRETGDRSPDAGAWGNQLELRVTQTALVQTQITPADIVNEGTGFLLDNLTGLQKGTILRISQTHGDLTEVLNIIPDGVDAARRFVLFDKPLDQYVIRWDDHDGDPLTDAIPITLDLAAPFRIESIEYDFDIYRAGKLMQSFRGLSPNPHHPRAIDAVFAAESRHVHFAPVVQRDTGTGWQVETPDMTTATLAQTNWADPETWPLPGVFTLGGGADGLADLTVADYQAALARIARLPEVALIAAPDLVLQDSLVLGGDTFTPTPVDCTDLTPPPENVINGFITGTNTAGVEVPLASVAVDPAGQGRSVRTDTNGQFTLTGVAAGIVTLRLSKAGYEDLEFLAQSSPFASSAAVEIAMTPFTRPAIFAPDSVLRVQAMMANPAVVGPYKVAILDVPSPDAQLQDITTWRTQLGDLPRAVLAGPWLMLPGQSGNMPASCHLCGATAHAERTVGVHRTGANLALRHVEGTTLPLDDVAYSLLNAAHVTAMIVGPGQGIRAGGARSLAADATLRYLSTRRILDVLERTLEQVLQPLVFEPNNLFTRQAILLTASSLLDRMWRIGALAGAAAPEAYTVKCDLENNPDESRADGRLIVDIGVAPTIPMEFIYFRLGHVRDITKVTEAQS